MNYFELSRLFNRIPYFEENYEGKVSDVSNVEFTRDQILEKIATTMEEAAIATIRTHRSKKHSRQW